MFILLGLMAEISGSFLKVETNIWSYVLNYRVVYICAYVYDMCMYDI